MKISFLEYKKKRESKLSLLKRSSGIFFGIGMLTIILMKSLDSALSERVLFMVFGGIFALLLISAIMNLFLKIKCPECKKDVAFKEGDFCSHCSCDFKEHLQEFDDLS